MTDCRCEHDRVLHNENGQCIALILTLTTWSAGCGCFNYIPQPEPK